MDLEFQIIKLIRSKSEGNYWDFKMIPHEDNFNLLHDILCLANTKHNGDRFIIIGVKDPSENCEIVGLDKNTPYRKNEADINRFLLSKDFAGGNVPKVKVRTLNIGNKEIDVIIIKNSHLKPFYLVKKYKTVKPYYIYTRVGDTNTPINESAKFQDVKEMWEEHFGLNLNIEERFKFYLNDFDNWKCDFDNGKNAIYLPQPNFSIELSDFENTNYVEPLNVFYLDNSCFFGDVLFKYGQNIIFEETYFLCDTVSVLIPNPSLCIIYNNVNERIGFYYYNLNEINGVFAKFLTKGLFDFRGRISGFPFIVVHDEIMLEDFKNYLINNLDYLRNYVVNWDKLSVIINKNDPNNYTNSLDLEKLCSIYLIFDEWIKKYQFEI